MTALPLPSSLRLGPDRCRTCRLRCFCDCEGYGCTYCDGYDEHVCVDVGYSMNREFHRTARVEVTLDWAEDRVDRLAGRFVDWVLRPLAAAAAWLWERLDPHR